MLSLIINIYNTAIRPLSGVLNEHAVETGPLFTKYAVETGPLFTCPVLHDPYPGSGVFKNRNGPNNQKGPGITGMDLSFTFLFSSPIFISLLFSSYVFLIITLAILTLSPFNFSLF